VVSGTQRWSSYYDDGSDDYATAIAITEDGATLVVTGYSFVGDSVSDYATAAYRSTDGREVWAARYNGTGMGHDVARALEVSPDGSRVFVTGESQSSGITDDYASIAYRTVDGAQLWVSRFNGPGDGNDSANSVAVSTNGSVIFVGGYSTGSNTSADYATLAYDAVTGRQLRAIRAGGLGADASVAIEVSSEGPRLFVTGTIQVSINGNTDYGTLAYAI
jgi:glucose dehydrogenase